MARENKAGKGFNRARKHKTGKVLNREIKNKVRKMKKVLVVVTQAHLHLSKFH